VAGVSDPGLQAENLVRLGNTAFENGDFAAALDFFTRAEAHIIDPGLVAFNKGAALYRLGRFRDAELHYLRSKEDAAGERLPRLLFNLGNSIVQQAQDQDAKLLGQAIEYYEECLRNKVANPELQANARRNLQLAKALLVRAKTVKKNISADDPHQADNTTENSQENKGGTGREVEVGLGEGAGDRVGITQKRGDPSAKGSSSSQTPNPGVGNLPPIPDNDDLLPISPEDATAYLEQVANRVARERREHKQRSLPTLSRTLKDW
jgi:tetratricopeptide (TPR) repeat protein